jgi:hypothetical protein
VSLSRTGGRRADPRWNGACGMAPYTVQARRKGVAGGWFLPRMCRLDAAVAGGVYQAYPVRIHKRSHARGVTVVGAGEIGFGTVLIGVGTASADRDPVPRRPVTSGQCLAGERHPLAR